MNKQQHAALSNSLKRKYDQSRYSLLLVIILTLVNSIILLCGGTSYFLFSAQFVYYVLLYSKILTGKMDPSFYEGYEAFEPYEAGIYNVAIVFVIIAMSIYFLCWLKSKNFRRGWLIASLVLFIIDTVLSILVFGFSVGNILEYVVAAYVIYSLIAGIVAIGKLAKLPMPIAEPEAPADDFGFAPEDFNTADTNTVDENKTEN